jgi:phosphoglycerate kinase
VKLRTLADLPPAQSERRAFVRVDFNVPLEAGRVRDDARLAASLPTIEALSRRGYALVLASHLGRPKGRVVAELSLRPVAERLAELLGRPVRFSPRLPSDEELRVEAAALAPGEVLLLENLRFVPQEEQDDPAFGAFLASLGDVTVQDAFGVVHRAHASTSAIYGVRVAYAGLLLEREAKALERLLAPERRPFAVLMGGAKVQDKQRVIDNLARIADAIFLGGALGNAFLAAAGVDVGATPVAEEARLCAAELLARHRDKLHLPVDVRVARDPDGDPAVVAVDAVPKDQCIFDIGPGTVAAWQEYLQSCGTVFWNGPMGLYERASFAQGSQGVARALAQVPGFTVVGGGDSLAAVAETGVGDAISHLSTGGGASLEFLEGRLLPGLKGVMEA